MKIDIDRNDYAPNLSLTSTHHVFCLLDRFVPKCFRDNNQDTCSFPLSISFYLQSTPVKQYLPQMLSHLHLQGPGSGMYNTSYHTTIRHTTKHNIHPTRVNHCIDIVVLLEFLRKWDRYKANNCRHPR